MTTAKETMTSDKTKVKQGFFYRLRWVFSKTYNCDCKPVGRYHRLSTEKAMTNNKPVELTTEIPTITVEDQWGSYTIASPHLEEYPALPLTWWQKLRRLLCL